MGLKKKAITGTLYQIAWSNPYTDPPSGAPRVLAEVFVLGRQAPPEEFESIPCSLGGGYSHYLAYVAPPPRTLPPETLAGIRKKRLARRVAAKYPMFADEFTQQALVRNPDYYAGITDSAIQERANATLAQEWQRYYERISRPGKTIIYGEEPGECVKASARLKAEMNALTRK